jgi:hypothetical protein
MITLKKVLVLLGLKLFREEPGRLFGSSKRKLKRLKNKFEGETCVIIGNGPSLNEVDFATLAKCKSFGVNGIFYKSDEIGGWRPDFYVVEDTAVMKENIARIREYDCEYKFFPSMYKTLHKGAKNVFWFNMNRGFYDEQSEWFEFSRFSPDCSRQVYCGQSVTIVNLQLAFYMGFTKVLLVGMDFNYEKVGDEIVKGHKLLSQSDDINHFHPDYFGKGKTWHDPKIHNVHKSYELAKLVYEQNGREIVNCTIGGKLELFRRSTLELEIK